MTATRNSSKPQRRRRVVQTLSKNARKQSKLQADIFNTELKIQKLQCKLEHLKSQIQETYVFQSKSLKKFEIVLDDEVDFVIEDTDNESTDNELYCDEWYPGPLIPYALSFDICK